MYDVVIQNGTIIDGSGEPMFRGDIAFQEGQIVAVGEIEGAAERLIDATGYYVTPGFIDVNNHSDTYWQIFGEPTLESLLYQGITTIVGGNSGSSLAPLTQPSTIRSIQKWTDVNRINFNWLTFAEFYSVIEKHRLSVNFASLVGHGTLRRGVMKDETRPIHDSEVEVMERLLRQSFHEGALGFSTGLLYTHARSAHMNEILRLAQIVHDQKGVYATYVRNESEGLVGAVEEAITTARKANVPLHISHLKAVGEKNWLLMDEVFNLIETAALNALDITFDVYPYTATGSVLYTFLPQWITENGAKLMLARLRDPKVRETVVQEMTKSGVDFGSMFISVSGIGKMLNRRRISEIAALHGQRAEETALDILLASEGRAIVSIESLSEKNVRRAIQHPFSFVSSNGAGYSRDHAKTGDHVHPRNFGTFPRVFAEYVRRDHSLSWEEAVCKMTGKPAKKFRLRGKGFLRMGADADIAIIDPERIADRATMENPYQYAEGVEYLFVNGVSVLEKRVYTGKRPGRLYRAKHSWFGW